MSKRVLYLPYSQPIIRVVGAFVWAVAVGFVVRVTVGPDFLLVIAAAALALLSFFPAANWWSACRGATFVSREERERRYARELLAQPMWQGAVQQAVILTFVIPSAQVLSSAIDDPEWWERLSFLPILIVVMLPVGTILALASTHHQRRMVQQRLETDVIASPASETPWPSFAELRTYFFTLTITFVTGAAVALVCGLLLGDRIAGAIGFVLGVICGAWLGFYFTGQLRRRTTLDVSSGTLFMRAVLFFGVGFGVPLALTLGGAWLIAAPHAVWSELFDSMLTVCAGVITAGVFLWAAVQANDWTPGHSARQHQ